MERRLKLGVVSMNDVANGGKGFAEILKKSIPDGVQILKQQENLQTGSLELLLYKEDWDVAPKGKQLEQVIIEAKRPIIERV